MQPSLRPARGLRDNPWLPIALASAGWASGSVATKAALGTGLGPFAVMNGRFLVGTIALILGLAVLGRLRALDREALGKGIVLGVVNMALPTVFFTMALETITASLGGILIALVPAATIAGAHLVVPEERFEAWRVPGLVVAFVGVAVLLGGDPGGSEDVVRGAAFSLLGVALAGYGGALSRRYALEVPASRLVLPQFLAGAATMAVIAAPTGGWSGLAAADAGQWSLVLALGAASTALPFFAFLWAVQIAPAAKAALVGYLVPLLGVIGAVVLLGDRLTPGLLAGGALILLGVFLADRGGRSWWRPRRAAGPARPGY